MFFDADCGTFTIIFRVISYVCSTGSWKNRKKSDMYNSVNDFVGLSSFIIPFQKISNNPFKNPHFLKKSNPKLETPQSILPYLAHLLRQHFFFKLQESQLFSNQTSLKNLTRILRPFIDNKNVLSTHKMSSQFLMNSYQDFRCQ